MQTNMEMNMEDDDLFDPTKEENFLTFQRFSDMALAASLSETLSKNHIECRLEKDVPILDSIFGGVSSIPDILIKIKSSDFIRAHQSLEDFYKKDIDTISSSYYLFEFTNEELLEILHKPDEWGPLDYQLAQKILTDRNCEVPVSTTKQLKVDRIEQLSKTDSGDNLILVISIFIIYVFASIILMRINHSYNFPYSIFIILLGGSHLAYGRKTLPNGKQTFVFNEKDRKTGRLINMIGLVFLFYVTLTLILLTSKVSFDLFDFSF